MKKIIAFTPADANNDRFVFQLQNSLRKFHTEEELPLIRYDLSNVQDPMKWYRATPMIARDLLKEYETVIKLDADQIITGSLDEILKDENEFDTGVVLNDPSFPLAAWDIQPYLNNGLVVMKNKDFVEHWWRLCNTPHFNNYQFREQDLLNIICSDYMKDPYKVKCYDDKNIYGELAKPFWAESYLRDNKLYVKMQDLERGLQIIHFGGGNAPDKGNYRIRFSPEVVKYIEGLVK